MASPPSHLYVAEEDGGDPNVVSPAAALACPFPLGRGALPPSPSPSSAPSPSPSLTLPVVNDSVADAPASPASASLPRALRGAYIALRPGVTWRMMCTFFYASLITITVRLACLCCFCAMAALSCAAPTRRSCSPPPLELH